MSRFEIATIGTWSTGEMKVLLDVWGADNVQHHLDGIVQNQAIYQKVASSVSELGYKRMWQQVLLLSDSHSFLHEGARTRATTKPTLPVESVLLRGVFYHRTNDTDCSRSERPYFVVQTWSKWTDGPLHADLTPWSRCEINVNSIWFKCRQALTWPTCTTKEGPIPLGSSMVCGISLFMYLKNMRQAKIWEV